MIVADGGEVLVNGGRVLKADVPARNGLIHVIDAVLVPRGVQEVLVRGGRGAGAGITGGKARSVT